MELHTSLFAPRYQWYVPGAALVVQQDENVVDRLWSRRGKF